MDQDAARAKTEAMLKELWRRKLPMVREHLDLLTQAAELIHSESLTAPLRSEAAISAHKLAGSLGMFGYPEGTRIAESSSIFLTRKDIRLPTPSAAWYDNYVRAFRFRAQQRAIPGSVFGRG